MADAGADSRTYHVVSNSMKQYSIWPTDRELPAGWIAEGIAGPKETCLARIAEVWNDLRPGRL